MSKARKLYFDITDLTYYAKAHNTVSGIQRTSLRIIERIIQDREREVCGFFKDRLARRHYTTDLSFIRSRYDIAEFAYGFHPPRTKQDWLDRKLAGLETRPVKRTFRKFKLETRWLINPHLRQRHTSPRPGEKPSRLKDAQIERGGVVVSLGAGWVTDYRRHASIARIRGGATVYIVYDTIPVTAPQYTPANSYGDTFARWLKFIAHHADLLLCISLASKSDLERYLADHGIKAAVEVLPFPHEFIESPMQDIRPSVQSLAGGDFVLCVGTIEIRKNVIGLLKAWADLAAKRAQGVPDLVLAGRRGWEVDDVYEFLDRTRFLGGKVKIVGAPNDSELAFLYRHCRFTVFPSFMEGWGLPIGESLWFGKPVLCANTSSMPEAGRRFATYFSHGNPASLKDRLNWMLDHPPVLPQDIRSHLTTWQDTADALLTAIDRLPPRTQKSGASLRRSWLGPVLNGPRLPSPLGLQSRGHLLARLGLS